MAGLAVRITPLVTQEIGLITRKVGLAMPWLLLFLAAFLEVGWAVGLKYTDGFTRWWPSVWTALAMVGSMVMLAWAARSIPIGTAYAVWTGIGAAGTAILGVYLFAEPASAPRLAGIALIVLGVALLRAWS
jgi:quaternary ammonium compound-resistance protein SugE